ncbi:hypothetical protein ACFY5H_16745 [Streptomyces sp. NPDC013012]|uniref:hypothetical protein n=1 Tax=Streptomyces sp. NPDC013012 TaxID=3364860 RepID=UPI0036B79415
MGTDMGTGTDVDVDVDIVRGPRVRGGSVPGPARVAPFLFLPLGFLGVLGLLLTGCAPPPVAPGPGGPSSRPAVSPADGPLPGPRVTEERYRAAFAAYADCMGERGFPLRIVPGDGPLVRYGIPEGATKSGADEACYAPFLPVDRAWQAANEPPGERDARLRACLRAHGVEPTGPPRAAVALVEEHRLTRVCTYA